jgi:hypothetical protein
MTPEEFAEIVVEGDAKKLIAAVAGLDESQRRKLAKMAARIEKSTHTGLHNNPEKELIDELRKRMGGRCRPHRGVCHLALMAVGSFTQVRSLFDQGVETWEDALVQILADRRPEWIDRWVETRLTSEMRHYFEWSFVTRLIRAGAWKKSGSDAYWRFMVQAAISHSWQTHVPISKMLLENPSVMEDVWKLFEVETRALWSGSSENEANSNHDSWPAALVELSEQGHLDRQRLLDASLKALSSGFMNDVLTSYMRFFERLEPSVEEIACRQTTLFGLLANPASHVVGFAVEKASELDRAGSLDAAMFLNAVPSVFQTRSKGQPLAALRLIEQIVKRSPEHLPHAVAGLLEALTHSAADVQKKAIGLLETWTTRLHPDHATAIRERIEELAPSVRARAAAIADKLSPVTSQSPEASTPVDDLAARFAELAATAEQIPSRWRQLAGVDEAIAAIRSGNMPAPLKFDVMAVPVLSGVKPIVPIGSVEELIDAVAHAVETVESADEVERILDGICRLCDQRPADFQQRTSPLAARVADSNFEQGTRGLATQGLFPEAMYQSLLLWLCGAVPPPRYEVEQRAAIDLFLEGRLRELIERLSIGRAAPLLAAPTHQGGWIDPRVLVARLEALKQAGVEPSEYDMVQALLRLAPDGRSAALTSASSLAGDIGRMFRWALGGDESPDESDARHASLWLAAGRARQPRAELRELETLGIPANLPDAIAAARYVWKAQAASDGIPWHGIQTSAVEICEEPSGSYAVCSATWPTVIQHDRTYWGKQPLHYPVKRPDGTQFMHTILIRGVFFMPWRIGVVAQTWPLCVDSFFAQAACECGWRMDKPASATEPNYAYLTPLLEPDRPWGEMGTLAVWMGLVGKDADARTAALDVLIESISDGRAHPDQMGEVLSKLQQGGWLKLNRAADALGEVARLSPLHGWFAATALLAYLRHVEDFPRDFHFILSLLNELMVESGMALDPAARSRLEAIRGSNKTAKSAAALLKLDPQPHSPKLYQAGLLVLEARIARCTRWGSSDV